MIKENIIKNYSVYSHKINSTDDLLQDAVQFLNRIMCILLRFHK